MLLTMEEACKRKYKIFPNPERIDKVEMSMSNLESVVRERNKAYHLLETGETGERPGKFVHNALGMLFHIIYSFICIRPIESNFPMFSLFQVIDFIIVCVNTLYRNL